MAGVGELIAARLRAWGVDRVFGVPGADADALIGALGDGRHGPEFVRARHAESAALMACAHAKFTGRPGCCLAPAGSGALHLLSGLYDAALDRQPVVALVEEDRPFPDTDVRRRAVPAVRLLADVSEFCEVVSEPGRVRDALDRAVRAALTDRGVAALIVPRAVLRTEAVPESGHEDRPADAPVGFRPPVRQADEREVRRAAVVLNEGRRVAVVVGPGGAAASGQVVGAAELLGAGVAKTPLGRDVLPDVLPYVTGVAAPSGSAVAAALLRECDTLLLVGAEDFAGRLLPGRGPRVISADPDVTARPEVRGASETVWLTGDVTAALDTLVPLLRRKRDRRWRTDVERAVRQWRAQGRQKASRFFGALVNPRSVVAELSARLPDRSVVVTDSGSALDWWTRHLELRTGMRTALSGHLGTPGAAVPYAVAARLAFPDRPVIALIGDGALQANGMNELITVRRQLRRPARTPPLIFCVLNNGGLSRLTWERRSAAGDPLLAPSGELPRISFADYARLLGLPGVRCEHPGEVAPVWESALRSTGPVLLEFVVDGETPPDWTSAAGGGEAGRLFPPGIARRTLRRRIAAAVGGLFRAA
ncbi:thiamine pyrophosphate-binding protein [Streptomyces sp. NTH33]|uniref:thiamine pyrophosphate-binding protein n=1 Tax=Streptomyces sp. NTH33 TaxID=1735453 RepID=UPI0015E8B3E7|nr:thiamine pyrophosphate-binding protein [Streptomyces sp. NTH33]